MVVLYTIQKGDTLSDIAKRHNTTVSAIKMLNSEHIKDENVIYAGMKINIPVRKPPASYTDIGKATMACLAEIRTLDSYKRLVELMEG